MTRDILLRGVDVIDSVRPEPLKHQSVRLSGGRIASVENVGTAGKATEDEFVLDLPGHTLMPGLCDAHVHMAVWPAPNGMTLEPEDPQDLGPIGYVGEVTKNMHRALMEGYTTIRDAGGLDPSWARAVQTGAVLGPRVLPSGPMITQTGGHGDLRPRTRAEMGTARWGLASAPAVVDGVDEVRRAVRDAIRRGASQLKVMASGGVMSPSDELTQVQFTSEELAAAADEAHAGGRYVMAHCHSAEAVRRALKAGITCIEHATFLDEEAVQLFRQLGAHFVSTLLPGQKNVELAESGQLSEFNRGKALLVRDTAHMALKLAASEGLKVGSGSDILGSNQMERSRELVLKARIVGNMAALVSTTRTNAEIFGLAEQIGTIAVGKVADVVVVAGNPAEDISVLIDEGNIVLVFKEGKLVKDGRPT